MARVARKRSSSGVYHIMIRGINRQTIFEADDDRFEFLKVLKYYSEAEKFVVYGYCLMDNHVHLLVKEDEDDVSTAIKRLSGAYVRWFNKKYDRCGHLFQERFKSEPVETDNYILTVLRYIHQNPMKAGMCKNMFEYRWMSYKEYIKYPIVVETDLCLSLFSDDKDRAIELYIEYMNEKNNDVCLEFNETVKYTDREVIDRIYRTGVKSISELQRLNSKDRNEILSQIKKIKGIPIRQIARVTGISKSVIGGID